MIANSKIIRAVAAVFILLISSCGEDENVPVISGGSSSDSNEPDHYTVEFEPALSIDGDEVYFVATDSLFPQKHGIYRARVASPQRVQLFEGHGFHSPVAAPDGFTLAFLSGGVVYYLDIADSSISAAGFDGHYEAVVYINDSIVVACAANLMYLINVNDSSDTRFSSGSDPTFYAPNQFVCLSERTTGVWDIRRVTYRNITEGDQFTDDTLATITSDGRIRWVSLEPSTDRYVYVEQVGGINSVYTGQIGVQERNFIATTDHAKPLMLGFNLLIYSGPDGRFYQSTFDGRTQVPFWHGITSE